MQVIIDYFQQFGIPISSKLKEKLNNFSMQEFSKGEYFIKEGQTCKQMAFIIEGKVRHYYNIDGKDYTRWVSLKNNFVTAFASFINQAPSLENLECIEKTVLYTIPRNQFFELKSQYSELEKLWTQAIEQEMVGYEYRLYQLITTDAEKRYLEFMKTYPLFIQEVPQKYLASMLGIEPRHLSRIRKKLSQNS